MMKKKPAHFAFLFVLLGVVLGWVGAGFRLNGLYEDRRASLEQAWANEVKYARQEICGDNRFHRAESDPEIRAKLSAYSPSPNEVISVSYIGGYGATDTDLRLYGNGELRVERTGKSETLATLPADRCAAFFRRVLSSGVLNYSDDLVFLKERLLRPTSTRGVTCNPMTLFRISVPALQVEKEISAYTPEIELENYPDIIELQLLVQLERDLLGLVHQGFTLWERQ